LTIDGRRSASGRLKKTALTNTAVLFTFEGMEYSRPNGTALDLSQVRFRGQDPLTYSNAVKRVSYLLTVDGGKEYTINQDDFQWPAFSQNNLDSYSSTETGSEVVSRIA